MFGRTIAIDVDGCYAVLISHWCLQTTVGAGPALQCFASLLQQCDGQAWKLRIVIVVNVELVAIKLFQQLLSQLRIGSTSLKLRSCSTSLN